MPRYDYECPGDEKIYEFEFPINHEPPKCLCGTQMRRVFTAPGVIFKGSGFYKTDNK